MRLLGKYQSSTGLVSSALSCHLCMLQLLSSDTVSLASGLAAHETDDKRSLTRLTDTRSPGRLSPHRPHTRDRASGGGTAGPGELACPGVAPVQQYTRCAGVHWVKAYTGPRHATRGCHGLWGTILIWVSCWWWWWMAERRAELGGGHGGTCLSRCQPPFRVTARTHPSSILQSSDLGPRLRLRLRWTMAGGGQGEDWLSTLTIRDSDTRPGCESRAPTHFKYKLVLTPGFMDLIGTQIPNVPS